MPRLSEVVSTLANASVTLFEVFLDTKVGVANERFMTASVVKDASDSKETEVHVVALGAVSSIRTRAT